VIKLAMSLLGTAKIRAYFEFFWNIYFDTVKMIL